MLSPSNEVPFSSSLDVFRGQSLHGSLGCDGHEDGRLDLAMRCDEFTGPGITVSVMQLEIERGSWHLGDVLFEAGEVILIRHR